MTRHFLSQNDVSRAEIEQILNEATALRELPITQDLAGRSLVMFFEKSSTRTRLSFEIGMTQLGGHAVYLDRESSQLSRGESVRDTAEVVSRYADILMARVFLHATVKELAEYSSIPVINGLSDREHPMQTMADLMTIRDHKGPFEGVKVAFVGDGNNNVTHSLLLAATRVGADIRVAAPPQLQPDPEMVELARENAKETGSDVLITESPHEAASGADVLYADVWVSMGRDAERDERLQLLRPYQINRQLASSAAADFIFMHCLPQHVGDEVTEEIAYGTHSVIFDQAENRLHAQKAVMLFLLKGDTHG